MTNHKLDIFEVLNALDKKDVQFYSNLSNDEQKTIQPFVLMKWLSGTSNRQQIFLINEIANKYLFALNSHKDLLWKLLTICTNGRPQRYNWNKPQSHAPSITYAVKIIQEYFGYNRIDAYQAIQLLNPVDVILMGEELGWQDDELNKARKELGLDTVKLASKQRKKTIKVTDIDLIEF